MRAPCATYLLFLFVAIAASLGYAFAAEHTTDSSETMLNNLKSGKAVLVDVRSDKEWTESRLQQALHLPLATIQAAAKNPTELEKLLKEKLPGNKIVYLHCMAGVRCLTAAKLCEKVPGYDLRPVKLSYEELQELGLPATGK
jgi:phage shock protein E